MAAPDALLTIAGSEAGTGPQRVVRILGARYVAQSVAGLALHRPWVPKLDAAVDLVHAASMLGLALWFPEHRRAGLLSAAAAAGFSLSDLAGRAR